MSNELITMEQVDTLSRVAKAMVQSGYFQDAKEVAQAFVKVQAGSELGLPPVASMTGIHIVKGKPTLGANLIATLIKNDVRYNYRVLELSDDVCRIEFYEDGEKCGISEFTADDAKRAGTQNMQKFPKNMLFARAISNGAKWFTPGIFGGVTVYTPEELGADIDEDGDVIEMLPEPAPNGNGLPPVEDDPNAHVMAAVEVEDNDRFLSTIADLRATIEGNGKKVQLGYINQLLVDTGLYNATPHAFNTVKMWPGWEDSKIYTPDNINGGTELPTSVGLRLYDWAVDRKLDAAQEPLFEGE